MSRARVPQSQAVMQRRDLLALLGGVLAAQSVRAQPGSPPVIGFLNSASKDGYAPYVKEFHAGLRATGYVEGQNVLVLYRWAEGRYDRLPGLAADLVSRQVRVIAATSTPAALAAKAATTTIPIVFTTAGNPVELGLVASFGRPGGNVTGANQITVEVAAKRLELLHELLPNARSMAVLINPAGPNAVTVSNDTQAVGATLGLQLHLIDARSTSEIDNAFAEAVRLNASAMVVGTDPFFSSNADLLATLMLRYRLPTVYQYREFTAAGGLLSYGGRIEVAYRTAGIFTGRILNGEKPADIPVEAAAKLELIINLKSAKSLGLSVDPLFLARCDEIIE